MKIRTLRLRLALCLGLLLGFLLCFARPDAQTRSGGTTLVVPPYLDTVVFDILGEQRGGSVEIFPPSSSDRPPAAEPEGMEEAWLGESILTLSRHRPAPGRWALRAGRRARIRIVSQRFFPRGVLLAPAVETPLRQNDRISIVYRLFDGEDTPLRELPAYPLALDITLIKPDGRRSRLDVERRPDLGDGVFRSRALAQCDLPGRYWTEVVVSTRDIEGRTVTVLHDRWSGFSVETLPRRHKPSRPVSL